MALLGQGKPAEAEVILRDVVTRARARFAPDDPTLGTFLGALAGSLWEQGKDSEAELANAETLTIVRKSFPEGHARIMDMEGVRAAILLGTGDFPESERLARKVLEARLKPGGVDFAWKVGQIRSVLGESLTARGAYGEAEPLLLEGYEGLKADPKTPPTRWPRGSSGSSGCTRPRAGRPTPPPGEPDAYPRPRRDLGPDVRAPRPRSGPSAHDARPAPACRGPSPHPGALP